VTDSSVLPALSTQNRRSRAPRSAQGRLGSIVLVFESVVIFLATLVAIGLGALPAVTAGVGGTGLCLALLVTVGFMRFSWGLAVGWVLQATIVATGVTFPAMVVVGALFVSLWTSCMIVGARLDRQKPQKEQL